MVDDVNITETAESKASQEALDRARLARERREAEQRKRLDELRAHAAAAQAQREKRDDDRRRRQAEQRARDDDRRQQVEERKRAIWEASISRREALLQREKDRTERLERQRAARSAPRPAFAFGSSTPRLLEPLDSAGFFWAARSTNPIDQMNFFESLAASTTNVMFASAPLTRRASALQLDSSDIDNKDESDRAAPVVWCSVARRRTDLVPTMPAPRPGRAYSMTRLDRLSGTPTTPTAHISRIQSRSGETTPGSRPGSALSTATATGAGAVSAVSGVVRRPHSARKPRPASIAGTGVNTPRGPEALSASTTPGVSRDSSALSRPHTATRKPRPLSIHATKPLTPTAPGDGKPPVHRKPKPAKENDKTSGRIKSTSASPGRALSPPPARPPLAVDTDIMSKSMIEMGGGDTRHIHSAVGVVGAGVVSAAEVTHKLEALRVHGDTPAETVSVPDVQKVQESTEHTQQEEITKSEPVESVAVKPIDNDSKIIEKTPLKEEKKEEKREEKREEKKESSVEKTEENEMTASMSARRITTEEQAKAALAERRRRAREELERQAELERQRLQREAEEEVERQRLEEERQRREEEEARELAALQRKMEDEKLRKAIEAQQQLEREEAERKTREEAEKQARAREETEKRRAAEEAERLRREEAEREERERVARKQRVEAIMARTRLRKAEEDKKQQEQQTNKSQPSDNSNSTNNTSSTENVDSTNNGLPTDVSSTIVDVSSTNVDNVSSTVVSSNGDSVPTDNGNVATGDLLGFNNASQNAASPPPSTQPPSNNGNDAPHTLTDTLSEDEPKPEQQTQQQTTTQQQQQTTTQQQQTTKETNNGNAHLTAEFIAHEIQEQQQQQKLPDKMLPDMLTDDFTTHNGHSNHPLTLQNAI